MQSNKPVMLANLRMLEFVAMKLGEVRCDVETRESHISSRNNFSNAWKISCYMMRHGPIGFLNTLKALGEKGFLINISRGSTVKETRSKMLNLTIDNIQSFFDAGKPLTPVDLSKRI